MAEAKVLNLALQGGGAYGAFTWGVLDRLLEENIIIEGISGASAGALNAAALAAGLCAGGNDGGREAMNVFWKTLSNYSGAINPYQYWSDFFGQQFLEYSPLSMGMDILSIIFSPYQLNPLGYDPLKEVIRKTINLETIRSSRSVKLYISATNIETNRLKVFENKDICEEALLASSALPNLHQAVEWKGEYYWDGGFMGNPILEPLISNCSSKDIFIIQINPTKIKGYPYSSREIQERLNEIVFNSSLMREIRSILRIQQMLEQAGKDDPYVSLKLHSIHREDFMTNRGLSGKYNTSWTHLLALKEEGRKAAGSWYEENEKHIGQKTSMDLSQWQFETPDTVCMESF